MPEMALENLVAYYVDEGRPFFDWGKLAANLPAREALQQMFVYGACFDFSAEVSSMTGWPVREFHWGPPWDPNDKEIRMTGVHRVLQHPEGFLFDALGRTTKEDIHARFGRTAEDTLEWDGEVDGEFFLGPPEDESEMRIAVQEILHALGIAVK